MAIARPRSSGPHAAQGRSIGTWVTWALLVLGAVVMVFPLYWMFATAVRPKDELFDGGFRLLPSDLVWRNVEQSWSQLPWGTFYVNSTAIASISLLVAVSMCLLAGYAFAKLRFRGRTALFLLLIATLMIPIQVVQVPAFIITAKLGLTSSWWGVILPRASEVLGVFLVRQYMLSIPDELLEAARVDGASEWRIFQSIVLPLSRPIIAVVAILTFMWRWNDFAWPLVVLQDQASFTVPLGLNLMKGQFETDWTGLMGMALLSVIPILVVFVFFQRYFVEGFARSGMK